MFLLSSPGCRRGHGAREWAQGEIDRGQLASAFRASWLPKVTNGWFFRAESFFSVARYLDEAAIGMPGPPPPDFLSHSHGEGFLRFFEERCHRQGIYIFDEPESALSPSRQMEFLKLMRRIGLHQLLAYCDGDRGGFAIPPRSLRQSD